MVPNFPGDLCVFAASGGSTACDCTAARKAMSCEGEQQEEETRVDALELEVADYETLSPFPLSPYEGAATPSGQTPQTQSASPISPYTAIALEELVQAGRTDGSRSSSKRAQSSSRNECQGREQRPWALILDNASALAHLATFGILGVLIRYGLGEVFDRAGVTGAQSPMFHDLPANMFGCFFMGWVAIVLKEDIMHLSEHLALGLSTGLMGSITTFSSWMVKLVVLMAKGYWFRGFVGFLIGAELACMSLLLGTRSAELARWLAARSGLSRFKAGPDNSGSRRRSFFLFHAAASLMLWSLFLVLTLVDKQESAERRKVWLACVLCPPGVWTRWALSRLNATCWLPLGTLAANLLACLVAFVLLTTQLAVNNTYNASLWCGAIQVGTLGCLSTVSTLMFEVYILDRSSKPWRSYVYLLVSIAAAFALGLSFFLSLVWAKGYHVSQL